MLDDVLRKIKGFFIGLAFGFKKANEEIISTGKVSDDNRITAEKESESNLYADLLQGKETQQVKEFRYSFYKILRESENIICDAEGHVISRGRTMMMMPPIYKGDNLHVDLIQENTFETLGIVDTIKLNPLDHKNIKGISRIKIIYKSDSMPAVNGSNFVKKVVVKDNGNGNKKIELYFFKLQDTRYPIDRVFQRELDKLANNKKSDIASVDSILFLTKGAYGKDDLFAMKYSELSYNDIIVFNSYYVISFIGKQEKEDDIIKDFFNPEMEKKYLNKEKHENITKRLGTNNL